MHSLLALRHGDPLALHAPDQIFDAALGRVAWHNLLQQFAHAFMIVARASRLQLLQQFLQQAPGNFRLLRTQDQWMLGTLDV